MNDVEEILTSVMLNDMDDWCRRSPNMEVAVEQYKERGMLRSPASNLAKHRAWADLEAGLYQAMRALGVIRAQLVEAPPNSNQNSNLLGKVDVTDIVAEKLMNDLLIAHPEASTKCRTITSIDRWASTIKALNVDIEEGAERLRMVELIAARTQANESLAKDYAERNRAAASSANEARAEPKGSADDVPQASSAEIGAVEDNAEVVQAVDNEPPVDNVPQDAIEQVENEPPLAQEQPIANAQVEDDPPLAQEQPTVIEQELPVAPEQPSVNEPAVHDQPAVNVSS